MTIDSGKTIDALYDDLLRLRRSLDRELESGKAFCGCCGRQKSDHIHDGRCSVDALSREFTYVSQTTYSRTIKAIELIEQLMDLR